VEALQRVVAASEARQKLMKMADRSELGWRVIQHYVADPIADSVEDEKRIKNATKSAAADLKAMQEKKGECIFKLNSFSRHIHKQFVSGVSPIVDLFYSILLL
jgi:hypothetical protein